MPKGCFDEPVAAPKLYGLDYYTLFAHKAPSSSFRAATPNQKVESLGKV